MRLTLGPGGQARYTNAAIRTSAMLRAAFKLALRQIEGLMLLVLSLMGLTISAPDHTTVSCRSVTLGWTPPSGATTGSTSTGRTQLEHKELLSVGHHARSSKVDVRTDGLAEPEFLSPADGQGDHRVLWQRQTCSDHSKPSG